MSITESERHEIYESLATHYGDRVANNLMSLLPPVGWADVATKHDLARHQAVIDARFDAVDARFNAVDARFDGIDARFTSIEARLSAVESSVLELHRGLRTLTTLMVSLFGLTLAGLGTATGIILHALPA